MISILHSLADTTIQAPSTLPQTTPGVGEPQAILQIALGIIGAFAVLMITVSGLRYVLSAGDPEKAKRARNGIIYSLVGLAVAVAAEAIVAFVVGRL
jgi:hypothetical protein